MNKYAEVANGIVTNLIVWDGESDLGLESCQLVEIRDGVFVEIGYVYSDGIFSDSPKSVT
ncbi:hypothetical protein WJ92_02905 [Burkholderia ubonensis]|nr:hypothetical protein WJ92_02905 [Burkholderia ubonensis]